MKATSTIGSSALSVATSVTVQGVSAAGATVKNRGVAPVVQFRWPAFTWMVKPSVRAVPPESAAESSIGSRKVPVSSDAVQLDSGAGVVLEVAVADWPGEVETSGEAREPSGVAVGPDASEARAVALGEAVPAPAFGLALPVEDP